MTGAFPPVITRSAWGQAVPERRNGCPGPMVFGLAVRRAPGGEVAEDGEVVLALDWVAVDDVETDQMALARVRTVNRPKAVHALHRLTDTGSRLRLHCCARGPRSVDAGAIVCGGECQRAHPLGRESIVDLRRLAIGTAAILPVVLLAACGGGAPKTASSTLPRQTTTSAPVPSSEPTTTATPLPFQAQSVTFVSTQLGWVLGTTPCANACPPVLLRTEDAGQNWTRIPAPPIEDGTSVPALVRFADSDDGWVTTGDAVWATHDGGVHWERPQFPGVQPGDRVSDVEASAGVVHAAFTGSPIQIESSPRHRDAWALSPTTVSVGDSPVPDEQIVLQGQAGWLIEVDRTVVGGARLSNGAWVPWSPPCSQTGGAAVLAASDPTHLVAVCEEGMFFPTQPVGVYLSSDGGSTFQPGTTSLSLESPSTFGPIASPAPGAVVMGPGDFAGGGDLISTFDGGATWKVVYHQPAPGAWRYVGFTTSSQGVAIENNGSLFMTFDGGDNWAPVQFPSIQP